MPPIDPNYVEVPERWQRFREKHPDAYMTAEIIELPAAFTDHFIAVKAYVFTSKDDQHPSTGLAWEPVPGPTNFTRNSELQNAETSAWGRALVAHGELAKDEKVASAHEVRNRRNEQDSAGRPAPQPQRPAERADRGPTSPGGGTTGLPTIQWNQAGRAVPSRIVELDRLDDGSWPRQCPVCLADVSQKTIVVKLGTPDERETDIWECASTRGRGGGNANRSKNPDPEFWAWSSWHADPWAPDGEIDSMLAEATGTLVREEAPEGPPPDVPDEWPEGEEPFDD